MNPQTPQKKPEYLQVKVMNHLLDVRGHFERERMERAVRALDNDLRGRLDRRSANSPEQGILSMVLLTALEKIYEMDRLKEHLQQAGEELREWRTWAEERSDPGGLPTGSPKE